MNKKILVIVLALILIGSIVGYLIFFPEAELAPINNAQPMDVSATAGTPSLSGDRKSIVADGKVLLAIDDYAIFSFFQTQSQLCDKNNITTTPERKSFCENKTIFKNQTRFKSIVPSPDIAKVGFTIESDALSPDTVAGIFYLTRATNIVRFLTNYYLGNEFISFSPTGINFVYSSYCFEGDCGFSVKNSDTLQDKINLGNTPDHADFRFVKWVSDNEIEYQSMNELKRISF